MNQQSTFYTTQKKKQQINCALKRLYFKLFLYGVLAETDGCCLFRLKKERKRKDDVLNSASSITNSDIYFFSIFDVGWLRLFSFSWWLLWIFCAILWPYVFVASLPFAKWLGLRSVLRMYKFISCAPCYHTLCSTVYTQTTQILYINDDRERSIRIELAENKMIKQTNE